MNRDFFVVAYILLGVAKLFFFFIAILRGELPEMATKQGLRVHLPGNKGGGPLNTCQVTKGGVA